MQTSEDRAAAATQEMDALLKKVNEQLNQTKALYESLGIQPGDGLRYLQSGRVNPAEREKAEREIAEFRAELENEARQAVEQAKSQQSGSKVRIAPNRIRI